MHSLPKALYGAAQTRALDERAGNEGLGGETLMRRAGAAAFAVLRRCWPRARRIAVVCGGGNNGGDGYVVARDARAAGFEVAVYALAEPRSDSARSFHKSLVGLGVSPQAFSAAGTAEADVVVDALFGTGLERAVEGSYLDAIHGINEAGRPVLALDLPSGLHADAGVALGAAVRAQVTLTFIGLKLGMFTGSGREYCGEIRFDDLGVPASVYRGVNPLAQRLTGDAVGAPLPRRPRDANKGGAGRVLVAGGDHGMAGAACLAGLAAYRAGAGLVTLATRREHAATLSVGHPELLGYGVEDAAALVPLLKAANVVALGPGLGQGDWGRGVWGGALDSGKPLVVDADGLNLLARAPTHRPDWILTPHPGEAARLLDITVSEVQKDRLGAVRAIVHRYGGVCVLKGSGSLIGDEHGVWLCDRGNPGMAVAGMGDLLSGVIAALRAQGMGPRAAAGAGTWLHACAGDAAAAQTPIGLMATDLLPHLRRLRNASAQ